MSTELDKKPLISAASDKPLTVMAGGGPFGFGGVAVYEPQASDKQLSSLTLYPDEYPGYPRGTAFGYNDVAYIDIDGARRWINNRLPDAPKGRQDVSATGVLELELFDSEVLRKFILENREALEKLGLFFGV